MNEIGCVNKCIKSKDQDILLGPCTLHLKIIYYVKDKFNIVKIGKPHKIQSICKPSSAKIIKRKEEK